MKLRRFPVLDCTWHVHVTFGTCTSTQNVSRNIWCITLLEKWNITPQHASYIQLDEQYYWVRYSLDMFITSMTGMAIFQGCEGWFSDYLSPCLQNIDHCKEYKIHDLSHFTELKCIQWLWIYSQNKLTMSIVAVYFQSQAGDGIWKYDPKHLKLITQTKTWYC